MTSKSTDKARWILVVYGITLCVGNLMMVATPLTQEDQERRIWDTYYETRPKSKTGTTKPGERPTYRLKSSSLPAETLVGLTIWRLRPSTARDTGERVLEHTSKSGQVVEWTPERIEVDTLFSIGDRVRLSIETPRMGYLYVINREQYADGTLGDPYLIFPTTRTRSGDNTVKAGRLIEVPAQDDIPNYFTLKPSRPDQVAEVLTMLVTPKPLENLSIGREPLKLSKEQIANWEKTWGAPVERFELVGGAGKKWTKEEKAAGADATRLLTQEEPAPQTVYRVAAKPGDPLLVTVQLRYGSPKPATQPPSQ
jgi:hypothetical protein